MVEVVSKEDFDEFKKLIEDRFDRMEESLRKGLDARVKAFVGLKEHIGKVEDTILNRVDEVEEKSKSFVTRLREAIEPKEATTPVPE